MNEPITVAIVDDDGTDRLLTKRALERCKEVRVVTVCSSAIEALREIPRVRPAVVLMDIRMPGMCRIECMRRLKKAIPRLVVIMLSGLTDPVSVTRAARAGAVFYLAKPLAVHQVVASIQFHALRSGVVAGAGNLK